MKVKEAVSYLSPTALMTWEKNPREFALTRVYKVEKKPQTKAMLTGVAFDELIKRLLHKTFLGGDLPKITVSGDPLINGQIILNRYMESGCFASLCQDISLSVNGTLRMEDTVKGEIAGVPVIGKPDLYFEIMCNDGARLNFVLDWKVNGYYSKASPKKGHNDHKDFVPLVMCGITLNGNVNLEAVSSEWATQVATYALLLGATENIACGIDQICGRDCKVAKYRMLVGNAFVQELKKRYKNCWESEVPVLEGYGKSDSRNQWFDRNI